MGKKEVIILSIVCLVNLAFITVYHKLAHIMSLSWLYLIPISYTMKACCNENGYQTKRSIGRNFIFNCIRCLNAEILSLAFFGEWGWYDINELSIKLAFIFGATLLARLIKNIKGFENHSLIWSVFLCLWVSWFSLY